jgi:hypothetical protein
MNAFLLFLLLSFDEGSKDLRFTELEVGTLGDEVGVW